LLTDVAVRPNNPEIRVVPINRLDSSEAYSAFLLSKLVEQVETSHCLVVQWDGHVIDASRWRPEFLDYDYIGAIWPQFDDGHDVGNGGFSLRSRRLMELCQEPEFCPSHAEDVAIGRVNRRWLERKGMRFAPSSLATLFSTERAGDLAVSFGYHGVFHMPRVIGVDAFWDNYLELDERSTIATDLNLLFREIGSGRQSWRRRLRLLFDCFARRLKVKYQAPRSQPA
jgi:hypothetical protein